MQTITLNRDSLHYRLATFYGSLDSWEIERYGVDICTYSRAIFWALFRMTLFGGFFTCAFGFITMEIVTQIFLSWGITFASQFGFVLSMMLGQIAFLGSLALSGILGALLIVGCFRGIDIVKNKILNTVPENDGFIGKAYKSWKNKFCQKITFK
jgi:hypothetical protein